MCAASTPNLPGAACGVPKPKGGPRFQQGALIRCADWGVCAEGDVKPIKRKNDLTAVTKAANAAAKPTPAPSARVHCVRRIDASRLLRNTCMARIDAFR